MTDWILRAPCRGILDFAPRDDAWRTSTQLTAICLPLLPVCASCPFNRECLDWVRPRRSHFDGIAAGRIWLDGMVITSLHSERPNEAPARTSPCGTEAGARAHNRNGERACPSCLAAARDAAARRAERGAA
jgi:hypothetical protein